MFRTSGLVTRDDRLIFLSRNDERTTRDRLFDYFLIFIVFFFQKIAWMWIERRRSRNRMGKDIERRERRNRWRVIGGFLGKCSINIAFSKNRWWNFSLIIENYYIYIYIFRIIFLYRWYKRRYFEFYFEINGNRKSCLDGK